MGANEYIPQIIKVGRHIGFLYRHTNWFSGNNAMRLCRKRVSQLSLRFVNYYSYIYFMKEKSLRDFTTENRARPMGITAPEAAGKD